MKLAHFFKAASGAVALILLGGPLGSDAARAQSPCFYESPPSSGSWFHSYSECEEVSPTISAVGQNLAAIGEGFVQQQLNFGAGNYAAFATPTGRLRHTEHDGLKVKGTPLTTGGFEIDEGSVFANGSYDLPGTYFGGKVRIAGLLGYNSLRLDGDLGFKSDIDAFIYGGSYLWSQGNFYSMSLIIGLSGSADASNAGGRYDYDVSGYFTNSIYGYTFDLRNGWKFDARVNLGHYDVDTDRFEIPGGGVTLKGVSEAWNAGITGTVFTIIETGNGVFRPYVLGAYKNVFDEDIKVKGDLRAAFDQANDYGKAEVGFDYVQGAITYGAALYGEFSSDEETIGGRLGASIKLQ